MEPRIHHHHLAVHFSVVPIGNGWPQAIELAAAAVVNERRMEVG